ncbi:MAG: NifB/NifX family molybdenum-iron cluster-binding protein [Methylococcales bacterium]|nr:NifB/NifX family molybdenum-iron cluster-binding protein [Methylococcales bacterium]
MAKNRPANCPGLPTKRCHVINQMHAYCAIYREKETHGKRIKSSFCDYRHGNGQSIFRLGQSFAVYAVDLENSELLEAAQFGELSQDGNEDKLSVKIDLLGGCAAVYCQAIGARPLIT